MTTSRQTLGVSSVPSPGAPSPGFLPHRETGLQYKLLDLGTQTPWIHNLLRHHLTDKNLHTSFFFFNPSIIYVFILVRWVFTAVWAFFSYSDWGLVSSCGTRASLWWLSLVADHRP